MHYDLIDLRLFVAIAEAKNLTRGAERVHLAASSASHRMRVLEESIGTPLLLREPRGVSLTRAGEALLRHARQVFAQLEQMHADLTPYAKGVRGHVSLWANTHATHTFLPDSLATFLQRHPQVSISLEEHTSPDVLMAVARGEADIGQIAIGQAERRSLVAFDRQGAGHVYSIATQGNGCHRMLPFQKKGG